MNYYINDFTEDNYQRLLNIAKENNIFCNFREALKVKKGIILRHDIDISVHRALAMSKIERAESIRATYFVYLHSQYYNVMEKDTADILKRIIFNGGIIGLHFEPSYYNSEARDMELLNKKAFFEKNILEELLETKVDYLSFHNPDVGGGEWHKTDDMEIGNMLNVYGKYYRDNFEYCSDSNGYWRYARLENVLLNCKDKRVHVLLHPCWWQREPMYPYDRVKRCVVGRAMSALKSYNKLLDISGRKNVKGEDE